MNTSALRTCPTRFLEVITGLTPLHLDTKERTLWSPRGIRTQIYSQIQRQGRVFDKIPIRQYEKEFHIWENWTQHQSRVERNKLHLNTMWVQTLCFTVGSKTQEGIGAEVFEPRSKYSKAMGRFNNICQAVILAIERCAEINLNKGYVNKNIGVGLLDPRMPTGLKPTRTT